MMSYKSIYWVMWFLLMPVCIIGGVLAKEEAAQARPRAEVKQLKAEKTALVAKLKKAEKNLVLWENDRHMREDAHYKQLREMERAVQLCDFLKGMVELSDPDCPISCLQQVDYAAEQAFDAAERRRKDDCPPEDRK